MLLKRIKKSTLMLIITSIIVFSSNTLHTNAENIDNLNVIKNVKLYSVDSYKSSDENIINSNQLKRTSNQLSLLNFNLSKSGNITGDIFLEKENIKFSINGELLKDSENKNKFYGNLETNNINYEIVNFSILNSNDTTYNVPILDICIKNLKEDSIEFYTLKFNQNIFNNISNLTSVVNNASIEDKYWFVKENEPEAYMTSSEDFSKAATI